MLWVVRGTPHYYYHQCHSHYQKCRCQIHLLPSLQSNQHLILYYLATCIFVTSAENCCGRDACGGGDVRGGGGVSSLQTRFYVINDSRFSGLQVHLETVFHWAPKAQAFHPEVQGSVCVSHRSVKCLSDNIEASSLQVLFCTLTIRQKWLSCLHF